MLTRRKLQESKNSIDDLYVFTDPLERVGKIIIDIEDITDFCFCPNYYTLKNSDAGINQKILYDKSLRKTFYSYLRAFQEDRLENSLGFIKYCWGKEWIKYKYKKTRDIIITPSAPAMDTYESRRKKGIKAILFFDKFMSSQKQFPIVVAHKFEIEILPNIMLTGTFEYIREISILNKNGEEQKIIQIIRFIPEITRRHHTKMAKNHDLESIALYYAFKELFDADYFQVLTIDVVSESVYANTYNEKDFKLLKETVRSVVTCMQNDISCIGPDIKCYYCPYRKVCDETL